MGDVDESTGIIRSTIRNGEEVIAFGHTHARNTRTGIGPGDEAATSLTGKPSFIRDRNRDIFLVERIDESIVVRKVYDHE